MSVPQIHDDHEATSSELAQRLFATRRLSEELAAPLSPEDQVVQSMEDASPTKWHLAHVTWFWEAFVLSEHLPGYTLCHPDYNFCFNSYYNAIGDRHPRPFRGLLTRPSNEQVMTYRRHVDKGLERLFDAHHGSLPEALADLVELGINHEQQHQELLLTDALNLLSANPLRPAYLPADDADRIASLSDASPLTWSTFDGGIHPIGHDGNGFHYDNESPRHDALIQPFHLSNRCVTNREWLNFIEDGGYGNASLWLADGWTTVEEQGWHAPDYWEQRDGKWHQMTLKGLLPIDPERPVCHVSYYEADAYARWADARLPTEFEWEIAAQDQPIEGNTVETRSFRPEAAHAEMGRSATHSGPQQMFGDVWEWTSSPYSAYPGYRAAPGAIGEYNGKFMCNQFVLRGASCATAPGHSRTTYRNFFHPHQRWQFMGLRLARDV